MPKVKISHYGFKKDKNSVYMFHNEVYNIHLFVNADGWEQAMMNFDVCDFPNRNEWKIYVACGQQPTGGKNARKTR